MARWGAPLVLCTVLLLVGAGSGLVGCSTNPVTGKSEISLVSESQEIQMGQESDKAVQAEYGLYPNTVLAAYVDSIGQALARRSERPNLPWHFRVLDSPVVNAFALPGGYIYVTRGLLAVVNSEAQLAGVLGHEIGHVTARHSARQMTQVSLAQLGLVVGSILSSDVARYSNVASQGLGLLFLKYSRDNETQADELGVRYATQANYDPREIPRTYLTLKAVSERQGSGRLPTFLSTHPDEGDRYQRTTALATAAVDRMAAAEGNRLVVRAPRMKRALDGLVYGQDPRQGYSEGRMFYHPDLDFQMQWPSGWRVDNGQTAVVAQSQDQQEQMQLTLVSASDPEGYVRTLQSRGAIADAQGQNERIGGQPAWVGRVVAQSSQGQQQVLLAAWVQRTQGSLLQLLGAPANGAAVQDYFLESVHSIRTIQDASKRRVKPNRLDITTPRTRTALATFLASFNDLAAPTEEIALINSFDVNEPLTVGELVKVVRH
jgi:predicted Zn-dependent protease